MPFLSRATRAKINLTLRITGRRTDGYHFLESVVAFADVGDYLTAASSDTLSLAITGPFSKGLGAGDNLVIKAAKALQEITGTRSGVHLTLNKRLPVASGIGGGSGDAAAALQLLDELWQLNLGKNRLAEIALTLGADIPVCLENRACIMRGVGENLSPVTLPEWGILLVNPGSRVDTKKVFSLYAEEVSICEHEMKDSVLKTMPNIDFLKQNFNVLEPFAIRLEPVISTLLQAIAVTDNCLLSRMSGSGATCFGLYPDKADAVRAMERISNLFPSFWIAASTVH